MDALFPMMYFQGNNFYPFAVNWKEFSYGRIVAPGLAVYMLHPRENNWDLSIIQREMYVLRELEIGCTFFRSKFLTDNTKGVYTFTKDFNAIPALVPPMRWERRQAPTAPIQLDIQRGMTADRLIWRGARDRSGGDYLLYNIYASPDYPVDIEKAEYLVASRLKGEWLSIPHNGRSLNYAVTAMDRFGNESSPVYTPSISYTKPKIDFRELIMGKPKPKTKTTPKSKSKSKKKNKR